MGRPAHSLPPPVSSLPGTAPPRHPAPQIQAARMGPRRVPPSRSPGPRPRARAQEVPRAPGAITVARTRLAARPWPRSSARFNDGQTPPSPTPSWGGLWKTSRAWNGASGKDPAPSTSPGLRSGSTRGPPCTQHLGVTPSSTIPAGWDPRDGAPTPAPQPGVRTGPALATPGVRTCPVTTRDSVSPLFKGSCSPPTLG